MGGYRPRVIIGAAVSIDGRIATVRGDSALSSVADRRRVHQLRSNVDAILVGRGTLEVDDPLLTTRLVRGANPVRIILDSCGTISSDSKIIRTSGDVPTIIAVSERISKKNAARLGKLPAEVVVCGKKEVNTQVLLSELYRKGIRSLLVEGGGTVNWCFLKHGLVDEVVVTVAPYLVGGKTAVSLVQGEGFPQIAGSTRLKLKKVSRLGDEVVLEYTVISGGSVRSTSSNDG